jgi:hypothetical protein
MGTRGSFPGVKQPGHEADHLSPSSAEVKNAWSYTSIPPIRLHQVVLSYEKAQGHYLYHAQNLIHLNKGGAEFHFNEYEIYTKCGTLKLHAICNISCS